MKRMMIVVCALFFLTGCAMLKEAKDDYQIGKDTPLEAGEISSRDKAENFAKMLELIPGGGAIAPTAVTVLTGFFAFLRGRRIRKGIPSSSNPATGFLGNAVGMEAIVQNMSNVIAGAFEVGSDNSPLKRGWKVALSSLLGLATLALTVPSVQVFVLSHPEVALAVSGISGLFGGLEKALSNVKPLAPNAPASPGIGKVGV